MIVVSSVAGLPRYRGLLYIKPIHQPTTIGGSLGDRIFHVVTSITAH